MFCLDYLQVSLLFDLVTYSAEMEQGFILILVQEMNCWNCNFYSSSFVFMFNTRSGWMKPFCICSAVSHHKLYLGSILLVSDETDLKSVFSPRSSETISSGLIVLSYTNIISSIFLLNLKSQQSKIPLKSLRIFRFSKPTRITRGSWNALDMYHSFQCYF